MATMIPKMVVISATFIPSATMVGLMSPAVWMRSKAITIPMTVPRNPSDGATAINSLIHVHPFSILLICTAP